MEYALHDAFREVSDASFEPAPGQRGQHARSPHDSGIAEPRGQARTRHAILIAANDPEDYRMRDGSDGDGGGGAQGPQAVGGRRGKARLSLKKRKGSKRASLGNLNNTGRHHSRLNTFAAETNYEVYNPVYKKLLAEKLEKQRSPSTLDLFQIYRANVKERLPEWRRAQAVRAQQAQTQRDLDRALDIGSREIPEDRAAGAGVDRQHAPEGEHGLGNKDSGSDGLGADHVGAHDPAGLQKEGPATLPMIQVHLQGHEQTARLDSESSIRPQSCPKFGHEPPAGGKAGGGDWSTSQDRGAQVPSTSTDAKARTQSMRAPEQALGHDDGHADVYVQDEPQNQDV